MIPSSDLEFSPSLTLWSQAKRPCLCVVVMLLWIGKYSHKLNVSLLLQPFKRVNDILNGIAIPQRMQKGRYRRKLWSWLRLLNVAADP